ncbi:MAG: beta-lactamase-like protein 2 [bacterium]|nr:beta-lactamase-like protein 2 [bacterium]
MSNDAPVMLGMTLPDVAVWSERVTVALGQNPNAFSGPGTNTILLGTGRPRVLLDPGQGAEEYLPVLEQAMERCGCEGFQEIVLTHAHPDHIGGVRQVLDRFGDLKVSKRPWPGVDDPYDLELTPIDEGSIIATEGATLRALHTPGHAPDHLCFMLEEERALLSGDNVLGVGTTVIPTETGDLAKYMASLERLHSENPACIYPAHGPKIEEGKAKLDEYIAHRHQREQEIVAVLRNGDAGPMEIVKVVYANYPEALHPAACQSVTQHLLKLEREGRARHDGKDPILSVWSLC